MTVTVAQLADYVGASPTEQTLPALLTAATELVDGYLGVHGLARCPVVTRDLAVTELASELWQRRNSPSGNAAWGPDGQVIRLARDAMVSVKPLLLAYRGLGVPG